MKKQWVQDWIKRVGENIRVPAFTSTTKNLDVSLSFSKCNTNDLKPDDEPVLFVYLMQNYQGFPGFRLNDKAYSNVPTEYEYLLKEGILVHVLAVERDF